MTKVRELVRRQKLEPHDYTRVGEVITDSKGGKWVIVDKGKIKRQDVEDED